MKWYLTAASEGTCIAVAKLEAVRRAEFDPIADCDVERTH